MNVRLTGSGAGRRMVVATVCTAVAALTLAACGSGGGGSASGGGGAPNKTDLTVTFGTNSPSTTPLWLGISEGFFAKHGLKVKAVQATSNVGATAVVSGAADIYYGEATTSFQAVAQNQPLRIVGALRVLNDFKFYTQPNITNVSQLKGKSIAISAAGDSTELSTRLAFEELGASAADVTLVPTGTSSNRLASLIANRLSGTLLTEPTATKAREKGMHLLLDQTKEPFLGSAITVSKTFAQQNPKTVVSFLEGLVDAVHFLRDPANKAECLKVIAQNTQASVTDEATVNGYQTYSAPDALTMDPIPDTKAGNAMIAGLKGENAQLYDQLTLAQVYDTTFARQLETSGYLKKVWGSALTGS
ncbi:MAG TPA: ABC transporter substrate-binding protein [Pseudonocardiaceae bacterium]|nr:ABC transporter substrate-binding protein [Pseudonocardiaceae bacterium]